MSREGYQDTNRQRLHQDLNKRVFLTEICEVIGSVLWSFQIGPDLGPSYLTFQAEIE